MQLKLRLPERPRVAAECVARSRFEQTLEGHFRSLFVGLGQSMRSMLKTHPFLPGEDAEANSGRKNTLAHHVTLLPRHLRSPRKGPNVSPMSPE
jgi:hypothetical protein